MYKVLIHRGNTMLTWCSPKLWRRDFPDTWLFGRASGESWEYVRLLGFELSWVR